MVLAGDVSATRSGTRAQEVPRPGRTASLATRTYPARSGAHSREQVPLILGFDSLSITSSPSVRANSGMPSPAPAADRIRDPLPRGLVHLHTSRIGTPAVAEGPVASAEIVDRQLHADALQLREVGGATRSVPGAVSTVSVISSIIARDSRPAWPRPGAHCQRSRSGERRRRHVHAEYGQDARRDWLLAGSRGRRPPPRPPSWAISSQRHRARSAVARRVARLRASNDLPRFSAKAINWSGCIMPHCGRPPTTPRTPAPASAEIAIGW